MNSKPTAIVGYYAIQGEIGRGAMSTVHIARHLENDEIFVVKIVNKEAMPSDAEMDFFRREVSILEEIDHPNIVKYKELLEDSNNYYLFMEYCQGETLQSMINKNGALSPRAIGQIFSQLMSALSYLHGKDVAHRDLKPDNIIISSNGRMKLIDFGLSTDDASNLRQTFCGSLSYAAPECVLREPYSSTKADMWSAGIILYCMCTGRLPWRSQDTVGTIREITETPVRVPDSVRAEHSQTISVLLNPDPSLRPDASEVLTYRWLAAPSTPIGKRAPSPIVSPRGTCPPSPISPGSPLSPKRSPSPIVSPGGVRPPPLSPSSPRIAGQRVSSPVIRTRSNGSFGVPHTSPIKLPARPPRTPGAKARPPLFRVRTAGEFRAPG